VKRKEKEKREKKWVKKRGRLTEDKIYGVAGL